MNRGIYCIILLCACGILCTCTACRKENTSTKKIRNLEYTVLGSEEVPEELLSIIDERKEQEFKLTYSDGEFLYIVVGYGEQATGGYSIRVNEAYLTSNAVYTDTSLIGPEKGAEVQKAVSYPFIVIKTEYIDMRVVFD